MKHFTATMDGLAKAITFAVCLVLVVPFITIFTEYRRLHDPLLLIAPAVVLIALVIAGLYRPNGYDLSAEGLLMRRPAGAVRIPLRLVISMRPVTSKDLGFGLRSFGVGGFFGYFGKYRYQHIGKATVYVTDRSKMILLTLADDRQIIISPDDTAGFVKAFNELKR